MSENIIDLAKHRKKRSIFFALTIFTGGLNGLLIAYFNEGNNISDIINICCALFSLAWLYLWICHDAQIRNFRISKTVKYLIILVALVGVPIYFWRSRSSREFWFNLGGL